MKYLFLLLFPFSLAAQQLPDTAIARKMHVKKVVVLVECDTLPADTAAVWFFDGGWKNENRDPLPLPERKPKNAVYDAKGRVVFDGTTTIRKGCTNDTLGTTYAYDAAGRLVRKKVFSCEKGDKTFFYVYDSLGRISLELNDPPSPIVLVTRQEYTYDANGRLRTITGWWTDEPRNPVRDSTESEAFRVEFSYSRNGLLTSVMVDDPFYSFMGAPEWPGPSIAFPPPTVVYRYVYVY